MAKDGRETELCTTSDCTSSVQETDKLGANTTQSSLFVTSYFCGTEQTWSDTSCSWSICTSSGAITSSRKQSIQINEIVEIDGLEEHQIDQELDSSYECFSCRKPAQECRFDFAPAKGMGLNMYRHDRTIQQGEGGVSIVYSHNEK